MKFCEFANERPRVFSQRVPGRNSIDKDGGGESRPEKAEHLYGCLYNAAVMRKIEKRQACRDGQEQNEEPERPVCLCLFEDEVYKL